MSQEKAAKIIEFEVPRPLAADIDGYETAGEFLQKARLNAGFTIEAVSSAVRVKPEYLAAIEETRPDLLPPVPYAVGFVKVYARALGLDAAAVVKQFKADIGAAAPAVFEAPEPSADAPASEGPRFVSVFAVAAIVVFALWVVFQILGKDPAPEAPPPVAAERPAPTLLPRAPMADVSAPAAAEATAPGAAAEAPLLTPRLKPAVVSAALTASVAPVYPESCAGGVLESVTVVFDITPAGRAANARVASSTNACFEVAALSAVGQWRFSPRTVDGAPVVDAGKRATLNFRR